MMNYYRVEDDKDRITCLLCRHYCRLKEDQIGICGVNQNIDNRLKNLVYNHPIALNIDPIEKKPLYHFLPSSKALSFGTVGCNFKCPFCQNWDISQKSDIDKSVVVTPDHMVSLAIKYGAKSIAYTYNEPTIFYPYAKDIGLIAHQRGVKNIFVSNGFESIEMIEDMSNWVDGINIDLKSWSDEYYKKVLKGGLDEVKYAIKRMVSKGIWVEITTLIIENINDSDDDIRSMAKFIAKELGRHIPWHLSAFFPNYKMREHQSTDISRLQRAKEIGYQEGLYYIYLGNLPADNHTKCPNCQGIIADRASGYCHHCNREIEGVW
jgi:pyruvate formate lyase activating enzyme